MPKLFFPNTEEALSQLDASFTQIFMSKSRKMFARFLYGLDPGDILATPIPIELSFQKYSCQLLGLGQPTEVVLDVQLAASCLLGDSIHQDSHALRELRRRCQGPGWYLEPYYQSPAAYQVGDLLGLPLRVTPRRLVERDLVEAINDKDFCKGLGLGASCRVVEGLHADNLSDLSLAIERLTATLEDKRQGRIMLRKVKCAGGCGNMSGTASQLQERIPKWYSLGRVLVEPFLDFVEVCGSLTLLDGVGSQLLAIDRQVVRDGHWQGFDYPAVPLQNQKAFLEEIAAASQRLGRALHLAGARGLLNVDWGIKPNAQGILEPILLECNFRHNGLSYVLDLGKRLFGEYWSRLFIASREECPTSLTDSATVLQALEFLTYEGENVLLRSPLQAHRARRGLVLTSPPLHGGVSIAVFGDSPEYTQSVLRMAMRALGTGSNP